MVRSDQSVALEWLGLMRKELERLKERMDWLMLLSFQNSTSR